MMSLTETLPLLATLAFFGFAAAVARGITLPPALSWVIPAALSVALLVWTLWSIAAEGLFGFWPVQTATLWGNQVWFDLGLAFGISMVFLVPRAREQDMRAGLWILLVCCSGSIGLLAMMARIAWLQQNRAHVRQAAQNA
jgi:hypothetical protein